MAFAILIAIYCLLFTFISWRNFNFALAFLFFCLPTYLIRFHIGALPTTLLEMMVLIITVVWLIKYHKNIQYLIFNIKNHKSLFISISLFVLAATVSIFTSINTRSALGEWKAFYVEPIIIFLILVSVFSTQQKSDIHLISNSPNCLISNKNFNLQFSIIYALVLCGLLTSLLSTIQHFTGWFVPYDFWQNENTFRVTAWYGFPNAVGLFLAPIVPLTAYLIIQTWQKIQSDKQQKLITYPANGIPYSHRDNLSRERDPVFASGQLITLIVTIPASILAIYFAKSTGALVALAAGLFFFFFFYNKKTRWLAIALSLVGLISLVSLPQSNPIKQELLFQDRSGQLRVNMWAETTEFLKARPITGAGLASYSTLIYPYRIDKWIEIFHHPHNIFLTMWVNIGLLGVFAFIWIITSFFKIGFATKTYNLQLTTYNLYVITSVVIILVMGLVDSPYIKNDLAILFWLLPALLLISETKNPA